MDLQVLCDSTSYTLPTSCRSSARQSACPQPICRYHPERQKLGSTRLSIRHNAPRTEWKLRAADVASAGPAAPSKTGPSKEAAIELLKIAAKDGGVPSKAVSEAMRALEKAKVQPGDWKAVLGGDSSPGRSWKLVFTSGEKRAQKAAGPLGQGGGIYVPINAVQRWDASTNEIENGIYLGHVASLTFRGPFDMDGRRLAFDFKKLRIKLGPLQKEFTLKPGDFGTNPRALGGSPILHLTISEEAALRDACAMRKEDARKGDGPFFTFAYVDDEICVARGRGGGVAMWSRAPAAWKLQAGVV